MARAKLTEIRNDLISDEGAILWSIVKGEQLEFPITLEFLKDVTAGYTYEAVIVEADSENLRPGKYPRNIINGGAQHKLKLRMPTIVGVWDSSREYYFNEMVKHKDVFWRLTVSDTREEPGLSDVWVQDVPTTVHVQFTSDIAKNWKTQPNIERPAYGFFELRVTEPNGAVFRRTWKPVRGLVQVLFSPTDIVPD